MLSKSDAGPASSEPAPLRKSSWLLSCLGLRSRSDAALLHVSHSSGVQVQGDVEAAGSGQQQLLPPSHTQESFRTPQLNKHRQQQQQQQQQQPWTAQQPLYSQPTSDAAAMWWQHQQVQLQHELPSFELLALHRSISSAYTCSVPVQAAVDVSGLQQKPAQSTVKLQQATAEGSEQLAACSPIQQTNSEKAEQDCFPGHGLRQTTPGAAPSIQAAGAPCKASLAICMVACA